MDNRCPPCATVEVKNVQSCVSIPVGLPTPLKPVTCPGCFNLLQNPSFEAGLAGWSTSENVTASNDSVFEGTQQASLLAGVASMFQDVSLASLGNCPLFLSFNVASSGTSDLTVKLSWLDANHDAIADGLRMFIPRTATRNTRFDITYFDISDRPPTGAAFARLLFSKTIGTEDAFTSVDQVILAPVNSSNLLVNPSFEGGLAGWTATSFIPDFTNPLEGLVAAFTNTDGTIFQDVPLADQPPNSSYLLSFGGFSTFSQGPTAALTAQVLWLDAANNIIGAPGLEINIPNSTLEEQFSYLTYLDLTEPAPADAVKARILFTADVEPGFSLLIDQILFARAGTPNLVQNPSFEAGLNHWTSVNTTVFSGSDVYEGTSAADVSVIGGVLSQDVPLSNAAGHCFLFNTGLRFRATHSSPAPSQVLIRILWLDQKGSEIGLGSSLFVPPTPFVENRWSVYTSITEPAPPGTVAARIQFTKAPSASSELDIDKVVLGRLV